MGINLLKFNLDMRVIKGLNMGLEPCTPTNPNHHQQAGDLSGAGKGRQSFKVVGC